MEMHVEARKNEVRLRTRRGAGSSSTASPAPFPRPLPARALADLVAPRACVRQIIGREREQMELKAKADAERAQSLQATATEKEMKVYARHLKMARHQRRDEYRREVTTAKIAMEGQRTEELLQRKEETLARRRQMRSSNSLARQSVNERLDKMRQSSSFDVDDEMRQMIQNEELQELLRRCDSRTGGAGKVGLDTMRQVLAEMQSEGKLGSMGGPSEKPHGGARHSQSEGDLGRPRSGR